MAVGRCVLILIMTTNAGARSGDPASVARNQRSGEDEEAINRLFTPVPEPPRSVILANLHGSCWACCRQVHHAVGRAARRPSGYNCVVRSGARLARRRAMIQFRHVRWAVYSLEKIKQLSEELLFSKLSKGGAVTVDEKDDALTFVYETARDKSVSVRRAATKNERRPSLRNCSEASPRSRVALDFVVGGSDNNAISSFALRFRGRSAASRWDVVKIGNIATPQLMVTLNRRPAFV